jgi:Eco57I restriction-modification methylase
MTSSYDSESQLLLPFSAVRNSNLFSNHWLERRLPLEPEWKEFGSEAADVLQQLLAIWEKERTRVEKYGDEAGLEHAFIQPMLEALGWTLKYQTFLQGREPDYALFFVDDQLDAALSAGRRSPGFWQHAALVADAKAWHVSLDKSTRVGSKREYPPEQIEWYLDRSRLDFGVLTNGRLWRLVPRDVGEGNPRFETYLQVDVPRLLDPLLLHKQTTMHGEDVAEFLRFYFFFSPRGFESRDGRPPLVQRAIAGSSEYRLDVSEDLKERVFEALRICIEGFLAYESNGLSADRDIEACRENSLVFLYRLLFVLYAEDRALLPYRVDRTYTKNHSLARYREEVASRLDRQGKAMESDYSKSKADIWDDLDDLFDLINMGKKRYGVGAYNGGLFSQDKHRFLAKYKIPDWHVTRVIDELSRAPDRAHPERGLFRVDYRDLAIQHLGDVYEGLLELQPHYATEPMVVVRKRGTGGRVERFQPQKANIPNDYEFTGRRFEKETVYLQTEKGERRAFGSYYTPDHIVDHLVENTMRPVCRRIEEDLRREIQDLEARVQTCTVDEKAGLEAQLSHLQVDFDNRVLELRILDPAMGSGHFLVRVCEYLAEEIATNPYTGDEDADKVEGTENSLNYWKRVVAETCIFGVDINPMAVELAKLALWLETVQAGPPLGFLDHRLRVGDSLVGARINDLGTLPDTPPLIENVYRQSIDRVLNNLLSPLAEIKATPSKSVTAVKMKDGLYSQTFRSTTESFRAVADIWCAEFFLEDSEKVKSDQYEELLERLNSGEPLVLPEAAQKIIDKVHKKRKPFFHWELEYPDVFYCSSGRRSDAGFDVIVGNPPYDVLSTKEQGRDISGFKTYIAHEASYEPSRRGKNNLYKLFICRALDLLNETGYLGFIVPMALLGDDQAADIRRAIVREGAFREIHAFPQKDNPEKRVFRDAKLSTAVFLMTKEHRLSKKDAEFKACVHPAQDIESDSPCITLKSSTISLYDPVNFVIVSCDQKDLEIATRILGNGRLARLGDFCQSFQGEVNETMENRRGVITTDPEKGTAILRGANICLYTVREASQGQELYLLADKFKEGKDASSKAFHGEQKRAGFQRSSPQNNFRRLISTMLEPGHYCFDTVSYVPESEAKLPLPFIVALLNSQLGDWYFRLGSTNSKVNEYQFNNLPCPVFRNGYAKGEKESLTKATMAIRKGNIETVLALLEPMVSVAPFSPGLRDFLGELSELIRGLEEKRGAISRRERSTLGVQAQPYQDLIDRLLFRMAEITPAEEDHIRTRLRSML